VKRAKDPNDHFRLSGFGHRVYKNYDPRARIIKSTADHVLQQLGSKDELLDIALRLEEVALTDEYFIERKLYPNVDFYSGLIYRGWASRSRCSRCCFAIGRLPGWIAHWKEANESPKTKLGRPRQIYNRSDRAQVHADRPALSVRVFVDLERYPIGDLDAPDAVELARRCRAELATDGVSILPAFVTAEATARAVVESEALAPLVTRATSRARRISSCRPTVGRGAPARHVGRTPASPRSRTTGSLPVRCSGRCTSPMRSSRSSAVRSVRGVPVRRSARRLNLAAMYDGDRLAWHYDQTDFVVSLAVQESESGGNFECVPHTRTVVNGTVDERYDEVAEILAGDETRLVTIPMTPGTLMLFEGRHTLPPA